ncbi:myophilin-like [Pomacea canaliculata]|uniref:myophilin-like n=1 Tax=Pomacea canaliculata TaxID=400727 RepID=UPI000D737C18|nr:myophilin-like [Pomacea canaliculata]
MSENRATKSGIARDVQQKIAGKYDKEMAAKCMSWLARVTGEPLNTSGEMDTVYEALGDGYVLCILADRIKPGCVPAGKLKKRPAMAFAKMEMIELFNQKIKQPPLSVPEHACFATPDLYEKQNMVQVITCLESVARKCQAPDIPVEGFGPKEAEANRRDFSEEQLNQGKNIIGLQMGSNKGASQSGQNFGKARHIVD